MSIETNRLSYDEIVVNSKVVCVYFVKDDNGVYEAKLKQAADIPVDDDLFYEVIQKRNYVPSIPGALYALQPADSPYYSFPYPTLVDCLLDWESHGYKDNVILIDPVTNFTHIVVFSPYVVDAAISYMQEEG